jgi:hypothetical protein
VLAEKIPIATMVPQLPPVAVSKVTVAELSQKVRPVLGCDAELNETALRLYPLPDTSVPPPASVGATVNKPMYHAVGLVTESVVNR